MSSPGAYLGVDAGSSGCKSVLLRAGRVIAEASLSYPTRRAQDGSATQDARDWMRALEITVRRCLNGTSARTVEGIGITAPAHNAVLVEPGGMPRYPVVLWCDSRPSAIAQEVRARLGEDYASRTNVRLDATWTLPQLIWLQRHDASALRRLAHILVGKDYLRFCLTGIALTDPTDATGTGMYDPFAGAWLEDLPEIDATHLLPRVSAATSSAGALTASAARRLGLRQGTPVVVGATDTAAELISVNAVAAGDTLVKVATTGTVVVVASDPPNRELLLGYPHPLNGLWYGVAATSSAAAAYSWLAKAVGERHDYSTMDALARRSPAGADGLLFLPFLEGERTPYWNRDLRAAFLGLSAAHERRHLFRAVLEGVALSLRGCWEAHRASGVEPLRPTLTGGGLASRLWRQIVVSALGVPAMHRRPHGPALGAAMLAQLGVSGSSTRLARRSTKHSPDPEWAQMYAQLYDVYAEAAANLLSTSCRLANVSRGEPALDQTNNSAAAR